MSIKKQLLRDLIKDMKSSKGEKVMKPMKVSVSGDSPEAIKEGLEMAEEIVADDPMDMMDKAEKFMKARMKKEKDKK